MWKAYYFAVNKNQCQPSKEQVVAFLLLGDDLRQAKLSRERHELLINQITQLVYRHALGLTEISRAEGQTWTWSWVAKSLSLPPVTSFGLAKAVSSLSSAWPSTARVEAPSRVAQPGTGGRWAANPRGPAAATPLPRAPGGERRGELARLAQPPLRWMKGIIPRRPSPSALSSREGSGEPGPAVSQRRILGHPCPCGARTPPRPAAPAGAGASRRPPGLRRWRGLRAPSPAAPSPSPLPPAPGPSSRHWFGAGAPGARAPLPAPAPAAAAAPELSVRRQRRGPAPHRAPHRAQTPTPRSRRRGAQQVPCRGSRRRRGRAAPAGPGTEMGSPARTGAMGEGPWAGLPPAAPQEWPRVRSRGTVWALAAAAAVLEKGGCARGTLRGPSPRPSGRRAGGGRAALPPFPPSGWTIAGNARVTLPHTYHPQYEMAVEFMWERV